ncbi:energy transducer TonB [Flammeovirga yaeyamensis]|uniref:Energy transducer TonB n=1 Tax=Flammeovirga yaeyamensis TaxID=367791 RepID=A0AAX1ND23_9BACT|nr:energy transducer TonB [Flammeovirga yaeyamensis]MBB3696553.1 outer membrane biosynthesis protein TonB [Flammeovirga yaeyamensis]NMF33231.1 hypothetical protein [Flammeovirga yaeyamensis]QWG05490.1 energy transducer TonB [Flammeovirga yaeyamensis]
MKLIALLLFIIPSLVFSQDKNSACETKVDTLTNTLYYSNVDVSARHIDNRNSLFKEISQKVRVSQEAKRMGLDGVKLLAFYLITEDGDVTGVRFIRGEDQLANKEEIKSIIESKKWKPAICNNEKVTSTMMFTMQLCYK